MKILLSVTTIIITVIIMMMVIVIITIIGIIFTAVEPVLRGTVLSGRLSNSRICFPLLTVIFISIERSPLSSGCGPYGLLYCPPPALNGHLKQINSNRTNNNFLNKI